MSIRHFFSKGIHLLLFAWAFLPAWGQQYYFQNISVQNGLPQSEVWFNSLLADADGHIWAGTNGGGVVRLSGSQMAIFTKRQGLESNQIRGLNFDRNGHLWITTATGGFSRYDGYGFRTFMDRDSLLTKGNMLAGSILHDRHGNFWARAGGAFFVLENDTLVPVAERYPDFGPAPVGNAFLDGEGQLWVLSAQRNPLVFDGKSFVPAPLPAEMPEWAAGKRVLGGLCDKHGHLWFLLGIPNPAAPPTGPVLAELAGGEFRPLPIPPSYFTPGFVSDVLKDSRGHVWVALPPNGVVKIDGDRLHRFNTENGMSRDGVTALAEDYEGNIWAGTQGGGLDIMPVGSVENFSTKDGLPDKMIFSVYEDSKGRIWAGSATGGFAVSENGKFTSYSSKQYGNMLRIDAFWEMPDGSMLIGTRGSGVLRFDGKQVRPMNAAMGLPPGVGASAFEEHQGLLAMSSWGGGLLFYDLVGKRFVKQLTTANGLPHNAVSDVKRDAAGRYWVSTLNGLAYCDADTCIAVERPDGKPWGVMLQLQIDHKGRLWAISFDQGLFKYENGKITQYDITYDNPLGLLYSITIDPQGNLWLGTQNGLAKASIDEMGNVGELSNYGSADGLSELEMNGHSAFTDSKGNVWFGHISGVSKYSTAARSFNQVPPISEITEVQLMAQATDWQDSAYRDMHQGITPWQLLPKELTLPHHQNYLRFKFATLSYRSPSKIKRQWMLQGVDPDWLPASTNTEATYSNIPYGRHTFLIRSMNSDGVWGTPAAFTFTVTPPFWETLGFRLAAFGAIAGAIFLAVRMRIKAIKEKKEELEALVRIRTKELEQRNEEIMMQNTVLEQQKEEILAKNEEIALQHGALESAYRDISEKNTNITASINYAKRIQEAMLPRDSAIKAAVPDSFVLYLPRDIVSGDFYWFGQAQDSRPEAPAYLFAAADCTGHGVPGAFMSMAGDAYLNLAAQNPACRTPACMLEVLDQNITQALHSQESETRDGMDIGLCRWEPHTGTLTFAGAKSSMICVQQGQLRQIKGTKRAIGDAWDGLQRDPFEDIVLQLDAPACVYLFSDGYIDQFGGPNNRKFLIKHFRELLLDIHFLPMEKQRQVLARQLRDWMGEERQLDDILVIGLRLNPSD
jgi:ligand-binding sensor domain-containing protein